MVNTWMMTNKLELEPEKTEAVLFSDRRTAAPANLRIRGNNVDMKSTVKYLGVILDKNSSFMK